MLYSCLVSLAVGAAAGVCPDRHLGEAGVVY